MKNNRRVTLSTNKNIVVEFTNERIIPASGLSVVGALLGKSDFIRGDRWHNLNGTGSHNAGERGQL